MDDKTCEKCGGKTFRLREHAPAESVHKVTMVLCTSCGSPVGVLASYDAEGVLLKQQRSIAELDRKVSSIDDGISKIADALKSLG
jgi:hypothetical protein